MPKKPTKLAVLSVFCGFMLTSCAGSGASDFPSQDITIYVPYEAGGGTDVITRALVPQFEEEFDQSVVVENLPGGSGSEAMNEVITSPPDGHTLAMSSTSPGIITPLVEDVGFTPDDYTAIARAINVPNILMVTPDSRYQTAEEFFTAAEESQEPVTVGASGATTSQTLSVDLINEELGTDIQSIPFDGAAGSVAALLGGEVDATMGTTLDVSSTIISGDARAIATTFSEPPEFLPDDVPSLEEQGVESNEGSTWYGLMGPEELPTEVTQQWESALQSAVEAPEVREQLEELGAEPDFANSEEFRQQINEARESYEPILEEQTG